MRGFLSARAGGNAVGIRQVDLFGVNPVPVVFGVDGVFRERILEDSGQARTAPIPQHPQQSFFGHQHKAYRGQRSEWFQLRHGPSRLPAKGFLVFCFHIHAAAPRACVAAASFMGVKRTCHRLALELLLAVGTLRPERTKRPFTTHKRTDHDRYAALRRGSASGRGGLNPSLFSDTLRSAPQT